MTPVQHAPWISDAHEDFLPDQDHDQKMVDMVREWANESEDQDRDASGCLVPPPSPITDAQPEEWNEDTNVSMRALLHDDEDQEQEFLPIICNGIEARLRLEDETVLFQNTEMSPSAFESYCGRGTTRKWTVSCRVLGPDRSAGEYVQHWFLRHNHSRQKNGRQAALRRNSRRKCEREGHIPNSPYRMEARVDEDLQKMSREELRERFMKMSVWVPNTLKHEDLVVMVACLIWKEKGRELFPVRMDTEPTLLWHLATSLWGEEKAQVHAHEICVLLQNQGVHWVSRSSDKQTP